MGKGPLPHDHPNVARCASVPTINPAVQQAGQIELEGGDGIYIVRV